MFDIRRNGSPVNIELDGMKFTPPSLGQQFAEPLCLPHLPYLTLLQMIDFLDKTYKELGVNAMFSKAHYVTGGVQNAMAAKILTGDSWSYGGMLNKQEYRAILVSSGYGDYCKQLWILDGQKINFYFVGQSKSFGEVNQYEAIHNGEYDKASFLTKMKSFVGVGPDMERYNKEIQWHSNVLSLFCALNAE